MKRSRHCSVSAWVGEDELCHYVAAVYASAGDGKGRHAVLDLLNDTAGVPFLLGKEVPPISNNQAEVPGTGLIDAWKVDFVKNAVA